MKLSLEEVTCNSLSFQSESAPVSTVELRDLREGHGEIRFASGLTVLRDIAIRETLLAVCQHFASGIVKTNQPAVATHLVCSGRIRNGVTGELQASRIHCEDLFWAFPQTEGTAQLELEQVLVKIDSRGGEVQSASVTVKNLGCSLWGLDLHIDDLHVSGVKFRWGDQLAVTGQRAHANNLHLHGQTWQLELASAELSEGFSVGKEVSVNSVHAGMLRYHIARDPGHGKEKQSVPQENHGPSLDPSLFDTMNGQLDADVKVSMTLPVLGKRVGKHHFRIPIEGGIFHIEDFERGLADLEDAFVNIRLRDTDLVLERDVPLIPGLRKALVVWPLSSGDVQLAREELVRLRTLPNYRLIGRDGDAVEAKSRVILHGVELEPVSLRVSIDETGLCLGKTGAARGHADALSLEGALRWAKEPPEQNARLSGSGKGIGVELKELSIGRRVLSGSLHVTHLQSLELVLAGVHLAEAATTLKTVSALNLRMDAGPSPSVDAE